MERRTAYYLYDGDRKKFVNELIKAGFEVPDKGVVYSSNNKTSCTGLAVIEETWLIIHPVIKEHMNEADISERSKLIKICDGFPDIFQKHH